MIWVVLEDQQASYQAVACNIRHVDDIWQTWITTTKGNGIKVIETPTEQDAVDVKGMIDFAVEHGKRVVRI